MREKGLDFLSQYKIENKTLSADLLQKVEFSILKYVYSQNVAALFSSLFCGVIIFIGLLDAHNTQLFQWAIFFLAVTVVRLFAVVAYQLDRSYQKRVKFWRNIYIAGSLLGGASWGLAGVLLLPHVDAAQQMLLILMLAGVTAGAVQLSAAVPRAAHMFLVFSVLPFIVTILTMNIKILYLFDLALSLYLIYSIFLVSVAYRWIKYSVVLTFELEDLNILLEQAATHDYLTKIPNRRLFNYTLSQLIIYAKASNQKFALLYLDLDHFKTMNDYYGHEAGDQILLTVVERLNRYFRKDDIISRLGGDEFAIIIENISNRDDLAIVAQKICILIAEPIKWHDFELNVSASLGIAIYPHDGENVEDLLRMADKCMYAVKEKGGNNFHFSDEIKTVEHSEN